MVELDIYNRQKDLELEVPKSVAVIGVGGVGSWVAVNLALVGVKKIVLVDHDIIEPHNLNRTLFKLEHIGLPKVEAVADLILERREDVQVIPIPKKVEQLNNKEMKLVKSAEIIVDGRDSIDPLPEELQKKNIITGGYDGTSITIFFHPAKKERTAWGDADEPIRYTITPSYLVPPQLIANVITAFITSGAYKHLTEPRTVSFDVKDLLTTLYNYGELVVKMGEKVMAKW
ncbi:ThiF family adenylyltransferase [Pyrococcus kukulkanii]|uniref:ThiF family adenylyltransferase n=1 Tax=Pyrococcus kukulkanii TaxID=1609559 RepID=UPI003566DDDE